MDSQTQQLLLNLIEKKETNRSILRIINKNREEKISTAQIEAARVPNSEKVLAEAINLIKSLDTHYIQKALELILTHLSSIGEDLSSISYFSGNQVKRTFVSLSHTRNSHRSYDDFHKNYSKTVVQEFLNSIGGSADNGILILIQYFYHNYYRTFITTIRSLGFDKIKQLSIEDTTTLQTITKISHHQRRIMNSFLISILGTALLASNHTVENFKSPYENQLLKGTYKTIKYIYISLIQSLTNFLRTLRDSFHHDTLGKSVGTLGKVALYVIYGDKGGKRFKLLVVFNFREEDNHNFFFELGSFEGEETYENLSNTFVKFHNEEVKVLKTQSVFWVHLEHYSAFAIIPRIFESDSLSYIIEEYNPSAITGVKIDGVSYHFDREDTVPSNLSEWLNFYVLPFEEFICGDCCFLCTCQGREDHSSSKCVFCLARNAEFLEKPYSGPLITPEIRDCLSQKVVPKARDAEKYGFNQEYPDLFSNISSERYCLPPLHLKLGIGKNIVDLLQLTSEQYKVSKDEIVEILCKHGVDIKSYHGGAIIGRHVTTFIEKSYEILNELLGLILSKDEMKNQKHLGMIDNFFNQIYSVIILFDIICYYMNYPGILSSEELNKCQRITKRFSIKYRQLFGYKKITPKFHILESHLLPFMEKYGSLLKFSEELMENYHTTDNQTYESYRHFRDDEKREEFQYHHTSIKTSPHVLSKIRGWKTHASKRGKKKTTTKKLLRESQREEFIREVLDEIEEESTDNNHEELESTEDERDEVDLRFGGIEEETQLVKRRRK